ncbi:hypothetical protein K8R43_05475 [archaeon]|nr:hypothetical protein [archaeon]
MPKREWKPRYRGDMKLAKTFFNKHWATFEKKYENYKTSERSREHVLEEIHEFKNIVFTLAGERKAVHVYESGGGYREFLENNKVPHLMHTFNREKVDPKQMFKKEGRENREILEISKEENSEEYKFRVESNDYDRVLSTATRVMHYIMAPNEENAKQKLREFKERYNKAANLMKEPNDMHTFEQQKIINSLLDYNTLGREPKFPTAWIEKELEDMPKEDMKEVDRQTQLMKNHFMPLYKLLRKEYEWQLKKTE